MTQWKKEIYNEFSNTYASRTTTEGIEVAFLNRPDFDTDVWKIRFDKKDYDGDPKILGITEEAFRWNLGFEKASEVIDYLKFFAEEYLKSLDYDFDRIPQNDIIKSTDHDRLPKIKCPKCRSENTINTGDKQGWVQDPRSEDGISDPIYPLYKCKDCGEIFTLGE